MAKWAPLVYGRTYKVDFRFLALPKDFTSHDRSWVEKHILAATRTPEKLEDGARWVFFQNNKHRVVGVACMTRDLIGAQKPGLKDVTHDEKRRPLYLFVGYVTHVTKDFSSCPSYSSKLEQFEPLIEKAVRPRWHEKSYEVERNPQYDYESITIIAPTEGTSGDKLNFEERKVMLWPVGQEKELWNEAAACKQPISLCLGMSNERNAIASPFLNCTVLGVNRPTLKQKPAIESPPAPQEAKAARGRDESDSEASSSIFKPSLLKISCSVVSGLIFGAGGSILCGKLNPVGIKVGMVGFCTSWVIGGLMVGFGVGWVVGRLIEERRQKYLPYPPNFRDSSNWNDRTDVELNAADYVWKPKDVDNKTDDWY